MKKDIVIVNPRSNIAIATLWTKKEIVAERLGNLIDKVNIVGTLYSMYGINFVIHTLDQNPVIDTLIVFGADLSKSGEALVELFVNKKIVPGLKLLWNISEIKEILDKVKVVDLRAAFKKGDWKKLFDAVKSHYNPASNAHRRRLGLEIIEPIGVSSWRHQLSGHFLFEYSLFRTWIKLLRTILMYGYVKDTEYGEKQKQMLNVMAVIGVFSKKVQLEKEFFEYFSQDDFKFHAESLLNPSESSKVSYTYGQRLFEHPEGKNQFEYFVDKLIEKNYTRRAIMVTWSHKNDRLSDSPPCLLLIQGDLSGEYYNHTAYFRSHDIYSAWPINAYGQIVLASKIAEHISKRTGKEIKIGYVTIISSSAHIYEHDWKNAEKVLEKHFKEVSKAFVTDPRGNFIIKVENDEIVVEHRDWEGTIVQVYRDRDPVRLLGSMALDSLLSMPSHAAYLAREIFRAYFALKEGKDYIQDKV
ncbi:MAG: hypothetical protein DRJ35_01035 [Thermoprotei archaeon]|nr:MAG: hypothetical protein DRJ35_01035 [Thermoprotei archaeon]